MRIVLFYSETESFNFFTDQLVNEFQSRGNETCILDLREQQEDSRSYREFVQFVSKKVDAVICFDGLGTREDTLIKLWDAHGAVVADILMDHPLRFHPTLEKHPRRYLLFCCDRDHVTYVREYFGNKVPYVLFMPHVGVAPRGDVQIVPYKDRKYEILFSATYYQPESMLSQVEKQMQLNFSDGTSIGEFYRLVYQNLKEHSGFATEQAVLYTINQLGWQLSMDAVKTLLNGSVYADWAIRQYQRGQVVKILAESGVPLYLLGRGWENHPSIHCKNVHRLDDRIAYAKTLPVMADAKINLNVMPWFKNGSHDRIVNTLLQHSVPLTDTSRWLEDNFVDGQDIALYDLDHLEELPAIAERLLTDQELAEEIIRRGYEKVSANLTWGHCAEWVLDGIQAIRGNGAQRTDSPHEQVESQWGIVMEEAIQGELANKTAMLKVIGLIRELQESAYRPSRDDAGLLCIYRAVLSVSEDKKSYSRNSQEMLNAMKAHRLTEREKQQWLSYAGHIFASFMAVKIYEDKTGKGLRFSTEELNWVLDFYLQSGISSSVAATGIYACAQQLDEKDPMRCYELTRTAFSIDPDLAKTLGVEYRYEGKAAEEGLTEACPFCGCSGDVIIPHYCSPQILHLNHNQVFPPAKLWMRCDSCGNYFTWNFPKDSVGTINGHYTQDEGGNILKKKFSLNLYNAIFNRFKSLTTGMEYLEIGIGTGEMMAVAQEFGYHVEGVEICREDCERISAALGVNIVWSDITDYQSEKQYDVIVMGDVLEHVLRPVEVLEKVKRMLKIDGVLWISTPNFNCAYARMEKFSHCMWHAQNHYTYISCETLKNLLADIDMEIIRYDMSDRYIGSMEVYVRHAGTRS